MEVVEGGNVLHHVKREGIVREGEMSGGIYPGEMSAVMVLVHCLGPQTVVHWRPPFDLARGRSVS